MSSRIRVDEFSIFKDVLLRKNGLGDIEVHFHNMEIKNNIQVIERLKEAIEFLEKKKLDKKSVVDEIYNLDGELIAVGVNGVMKFEEKRRS